MMSIIITIALLAGLGAIYILTYLGNEKTIAPETDVDLSACASCTNVGCGHHTAHKNNEGEQ